MNQKLLDGSTPDAVHASPPKRRLWWRRLQAAALLLSFVLIMAMIVTVLVAMGVDMQTQHDALRAFRPWGAAIQGVLIFLIGLRWQQVVDWLHRRQIVQDWEYEKVLASKLKFMLFLVVYWLLIPVGPQMLHHIFFG